MKRHVGPWNRDILMENPASLLDKGACVCRTGLWLTFLSICVGPPTGVGTSAVFRPIPWPIGIYRGEVIYCKSPKGGPWRVFSGIVKSRHFIAERSIMVEVIGLPIAICIHGVHDAVGIRVKEFNHHPVVRGNPNAHGVIETV